jgi:hypothetical protein
VPRIETLIPDIYKLLGGSHVNLTSLQASDLGTDIANAVQRSLGEQERRGLRLSGLGYSCPCALWHRINRPETAEPLPPYARIKFTYGHIIEHLIICLAKAAGHEVTGEQDAVIVDGVSGHRDCVIDGCIVDVKSAASRSFVKFRDKTIAQDDPFGYLDQLDGYAVGSLDDPLVRVKDYAYLLAVDKTLGHLALYEHKIRPQRIRQRIQHYKEIVALDRPPACTCHTEPDGKSGNIKLGTTASYSDHKYNCFPSLRTFLYASGPVYLTKVVRVPDVPELRRNQQ